MLFAGYRRGDANDPDGYVTSIAAVLSMYDPELIRYVTDPRTGISTSEKFQTFMPNSGELKAYCDEEARRRERIDTLAKLPSRPDYALLPKPPLRPGARANTFVPYNAPQYPAMVAKAQADGADPYDFKYEKDGISVNLSWLIDRPMSDPSGNAMVARMAAE